MSLVLPSAFGASSSPQQNDVWPVLATLAVWDARRRARLHFATLDDRGLADVGLARDQQRIECAKPFWQP